MVLVAMLPPAVADANYQAAQLTDILAKLQAGLTVLNGVQICLFTEVGNSHENSDKVEDVVFQVL